MGIKLSETNSGLVSNNTSFHEDASNEHVSAFLKALSTVSDKLDAGKCDAQTLREAQELQETVATLIQDGKPAPIPTRFLTPTELNPIPIALPTFLIPKLFGWIKIYGLNALYTMPGSMLNNTDAIQTYIADGLNKLSEVVMNDSQLWSAYGLSRLNAIQLDIQNLTNTIAGAGDNPPTKLTTELNTATGAYNLENTYYQKNLELCSTTNTAINQTSSSTTQTQSLNNQNITQGPLAMMQILTAIWQTLA